MKYSEKKLEKNILLALDEAGYVECTPVQERVLSVALKGADLFVQSQTGTGKTAAYLVCIFEEILKSEMRENFSALILVPTRELAVQVEQEAKKIAKNTNLKFVSVFGGVSYDEQIKKIKNGVDFVIGTPGRIIDLSNNRHLDLSRVKFFVIDEADRMFDMGFFPDLQKILKMLKSERQTMLFSATLNTYVKNLAYEFTKNPKEITIEAEKITVEKIKQELFHVSSNQKIPLLLGILRQNTGETVIIFTNTRKSCEILAKRLRLNGIPCEFLIGDLSQSRRLKILENFKAKKIKCLVATDVAARGIDVDDLSLVINFDLPNEVENYVHRIGRTARCGKSGKAYTFCCEQDVYALVPIERYLGFKIPAKVASNEDFFEDKSRGVYIRLEKDENPQKKSKKYDLKKGSKNVQKIEFHKNLKGQNKFSFDELSKMSTNARMEFYRKKYSPNNLTAKKLKSAKNQEQNKFSGQKTQSQNKLKNQKIGAKNFQNQKIKNEKSKIYAKKTVVGVGIRALIGKLFGNRGK